MENIFIEHPLFVLGLTQQVFINPCNPEINAKILHQRSSKEVQNVTDIGLIG